MAPKREKNRHPSEASLCRYRDYISFLNTWSGSRRDGVLILINLLICPRTHWLHLNITSKNAFNVAAIYMNVDQSHIILSVVYRALWAIREDMAQLISLLPSMHFKSMNSLIVGDFNLPFINWTISSLT